MEPIASFELEFAAAGCILFLIYGAWLCLRELVLRRSEQAPQQGEHGAAETFVDGAEPQ
jgi:hypothetical protein